MSTQFTITATTASGLEAVTRRELNNININPITDNGSLTFEGNMTDLANANLWLRTADRVFIELKKFEVTTFDELYENVVNIPFEDYLPKNAKIILRGSSVKSTLFAVSSIGSISKKAISTRLMQKYKLNELKEDGDEYKIEVRINKDVARVLLDTSGDGLHKRGYRKLAYTAPLKETLASAIIQLSIWNKNKTLIDPFCGSGTIPLEASMIGLNIAPGLNRQFAMENAPYFDKKIMDVAREKANDIIDRQSKLSIEGYDIDENAISIANYHSKLLGVSDKIHFQKRDVKDLKSSKSYGVIITNPPYGERLMKYKEVVALYKTFGRNFKDLNNFSAYVLTSFPEYPRTSALKITKERNLQNGNIKCTLFQTLGNKPTK